MSGGVIMSYTVFAFQVKYSNDGEASVLASLIVKTSNEAVIHNHESTPHRVVIPRYCQNRGPTGMDSSIHYSTYRGPPLSELRTANLEQCWKPVGN
jgi:hypothetical protein